MKNGIMAKNLQNTNYEILPETKQIKNTITLKF